MPDAAVELVIVLVAPVVDGRIGHDRVDESVELGACALHAFEIAERVVRAETAGILNEDVEKVGDGQRRRLYFLAQIGGDGAIEAELLFFGHERRRQ